MDIGADKRLFDRRLFAVSAVLFPLLVVIGFSRTYYFKQFFASPPLPSTLVHVHGLLMTAWVLLFVAQVRLISVKRVRLHQRLGYYGIGLAALIIATGVPVAARAAKYGSLATPQMIPPLAFLLVPISDLVMFAIFFGAAIYYRRTAAAHKSLMLLTALNFLPPALARITALSAPLGPLWFFGAPALLGVVGLTLDARRHGRINKVFAVGLALLIASYAGRLALMTTEAWLDVARWLTSFV